MFPVTSACDEGLPYHMLRAAYSPQATTDGVLCSARDSLTMVRMVVARSATPTT